MLAALRRQIDREAVSNFETAVQGAIGVRSVAFGNARTALWAVLSAMQGLTRVWVPAYTCVAVPNAVRAAGLPIEWVDIVGANVDVEAVLDRARPGDALVAQHTYGLPVGPELLRAVRERGVRVIEDRAHRLDSADLVGDAAIFSFEHSKVVSAGQGGAAAALDPEVEENIRRIQRRLRPISNQEARAVVLTSLGQLLFFSSAPGWREISSLFRRALLRFEIASVKGQSSLELSGNGIRPIALHPRLASVGAISVQRLEAAAAHRKRIGAIYTELLEPFTPPWMVHNTALLRYPVLTANGPEAWQLMRKSGIDLGPRWFEAPIHPRGSQSSYVPGMAPKAEALARQIVTLPTHPRITERDAIRIAQILKSVVRHAC